MCGRFGSFAPREELADRFGLAEVPDLRARYNIAPGEPVAVVRSRAGGGREIAIMNWGLIPPWADDIKIGNRLINARADSAVSKPAFRAAMKGRRALIPADGFYEWTKTQKVKTPYWFRLKGGGVFAFAGLWEHWEGPNGEFIESCAILTTDANDLTAQVHDRMPVILGPKDYEGWLTHEEGDAPKKSALLKPFEADKMEAWPVSTYVNKPGNEGPKCIEPVGAGQQSLL